MVGNDLLLFLHGTPLLSPTVVLLDPLLPIKPQARRAVCKNIDTVLFLDLDREIVFFSINIINLI
jgi:hypothetical protein